jgi:hypothetical protein
MTERRSAAWAPEQDLAALLDTLTLALLEMPDHEVAAVKDESVEAARRQASEIRRIIGAADADVVGRTLRQALQVSGRPPISRIQ